MPAGLMIFDAAGNAVIDTTTRVGRILGIQTIGPANGSISPAGADQGALFWLFLPGSGGGEKPTIAVSSTAISWSYTTSGAGGNMTPAMLYGVY